MIWLYRLLFLPGLLVALPYYLFRMWQRGGYREGFLHRFGLIQRLAPTPPGKTRIWLQAVSVGEILAIGPLVRLLAQCPSFEIVLTTTTSTGYAEALKHYRQDACLIGIFPLDFWICSFIAWRRIQPNVILLTESELWPEHLHQAKLRKIPAFLINARLSDRSFRRYSLVRKPTMRLLSKFQKIYTASPEDERRFIELGCPENQILQAGSIKFDVSVSARLSATERDQLRRSLGFDAESEQQPFILVGASTWPGEELALIEAQRHLRSHGVDCRLLLVPRHAERGGDIAQILAKQPLGWSQRSIDGGPLSSKHIYLADTTGELTHLMQAGDVALIGKSLPPNEGGQTPIEAAGLGLPILLGPNMTNFRDVTNSLVQCNAARTVDGGETLKKTLLELFRDPSARQAMQSSGLAWHSANRGSSQRIAEDLQKQFIAETQEADPKRTNR